MMRKLRACCELVRLSNLPTCLSNCLVGVALAGCLGWNAVAVVMAVCGFYLGGMALNDLIDLKHDRKERAGRPLVCGALSVKEAIGLTTILFGVGFGVFVVWFSHALGLVLLLFGMIVVYDVWHKKWAGSVLFMGCCRALVYPVVAMALSPAGWPLANGLVLSGLLGVYTIIITIIARIETSDRMDGRRWLAVIFPGVLLVQTFFWERGLDWSVVLAVGVVVGWLLRGSRFVWRPPIQTGKTVLCWLAGMCLLDGYFLTLLGHGDLALAAGLCFIVTVWGHRYIAGT